MAERLLVQAAARNNADWCDAFCRAHGIEGRFGESCWSSPRRTPPLYPDAVTLRPHVSAGRLLAEIDVSEGCSVKDSFGDLDLTAAGFRPLFDADWLWSTGGEPPADGWVTVTTEDGLRRWEAAWGGRPADRRFFRPSLLADPSLCVLARAGADGGVLAGAAVYRSAGVIGLSNLFASTGELEAAWRGAAASARAAFGALPLVAYDSGDALAAARLAGFATIGGLRVWVVPGERARAV